MKTAIDEREKIITKLEKELTFSQMEIGQLKNELSKALQTLANPEEKENQIDWVRRHDALEVEVMKTRRLLMEQVDTNMIINSQLCEENTMNVDN